MENKVKKPTDNYTSETGIPAGAPPAGNPSKGGPRMGKPPMGSSSMDMRHYQRNGAMPPAMRQMAPDYSKMFKALSIMNCIVVCVIFIIDLILFLNNSAEISKRELIVSTGINLFFLAFQVMSGKLFPKLDIVQHLMPILTQIIICTAASVVHASVSCLWGAFCIPIFLSVIYYNNSFVFATLALSAAGIAVSAYLRSAEIGEEAFRELPAAAAVIICAYYFTQAMCHMMNDQKKKMARIIMESKKAQADALEANKAKSLFLANMSHEIRTPINAILGMNEMILREESDPVIREYARNIYSSGNLLLSIINDVLDISKIESGTTEINLSSYDVSSLINDCYNMTVDRAKKKKIELKVEFAEDLPRLLYGDEPRLRQIIVNLLTNAVKYTDEGSVIFIVFGAAGDDDFILTVTVRDTGIGISEEDQKKLFKEFSRLDLNHNRTIEGTGLGLSIVKHLVDMMNGEISVKSELGKGSEFTVKIPQKIIDKTPTGHIELNYSNSPDYEYVHSFEAPDAHILAVDDLPINLMVIANMLKDTKIQLDTAKSGEEAVEMARKHRYDLILMDHMMPEMDGVQTFKALRADERTQCADIPVIMLTANALAGVRERYMNEGFTDYLSKPVRGEKLEAMIKKYLPAELIKEVSPEEPEVSGEAAHAPKSKLTPLTDALPEMNLRVALPYCCDDEDFLITILRDYAANTRYEDMNKLFEAQDFENYRINAHSLKSTSLTIGLCGLSERARASEFALKHGDIDFVKMNHHDLMEMYKKALDKIREFVASLPDDT